MAGLILGIGIGWIVDISFQIHWSFYIALFAAFWGGVVGFVAGRGHDSGKEDWL